MSKHEQDNNTSNVLKVLLVIAILAIIGSLVYGGQYYIKNRKEVNSTDENKQSNNITKVEEKNEVQNVVEEPEKEEPKEEPVEEPVEEPKEEEKNEEVSVSDEDKAKEIARKTYGTSEGVYFNIDQPLGNGIYEVSVRDKETTSALDWYRVNVRTGTVE